MDENTNDNPPEELVQVNEQTDLPGFESEPEEKQQNETDIIEEVDQTNTQGGQDTQSLQPGGGQTQGSASPLQTGSGAGLTGSDTSDSLNQGLNAANLNVGVASANSQTSIPPTPPVESRGSAISPWFYVVILFVFIVSALVIAYRRSRKPEESSLEPPDEEDLLEEVAWVTKAKSKKKKRKKPKKAHHR